MPPRHRSDMDAHSAVTGPGLSDLLFDNDQLVRHARTALAAAHHGVLVLGLSTAAPSRAYRVALHDDEGEALIVCRGVSAVAHAAAARQLAHLTIEPFSSGSVQLRLGGRLAPTRPGAQNADAERVDHTMALVSVHVDRIEVSCPHRYGRLGPLSRQLPLELYALAQPDAYAAHRHRLVRHVNRHHASALRRVAAHLADSSLPDIAAATIVRLDPDRAILNWINAAGSHELLVEFPRPADTVADLITTLRDYVQAAARTT